MPPSILWKQVFGLAAVQGAIALMWVVYAAYFSRFLEQFGFPGGVAQAILIVENILSAVIEPVTGSLSDQVQRWVGSRFPLVSLGVILSSALFVSIPAVSVFGQGLQGTMRWLLPVVLIAWAMAMSVFRSPALSLLGRYAFATKLPQAASILTLFGAVAGAMSPLANNFILQLGGPVAFTIGSLVLLGATWALRRVDPPQNPSLAEDAAELEMPRSSPLPLLLLAGAGIGVSVGFRLMMTVLPQILAQNQTDGIPGNVILGLIFVAIALSALPTGTLATRLGNQQALLLGLVAMAILLGILPFLQGGIALALAAIALGTAFSLVSNGTIPLALSLVPPNKAGLATGVYFGGGTLGLSVFFSLFNTLSGSTGAWVGAIAFLFAMLCVALTRYRVGNAYHQGSATED